MWSPVRNVARRSRNRQVETDALSCFNRTAMLTHDPVEIGFGRPSSAMLPKRVVCYRLDSRLSLTLWLYLEELGKTFPLLSRFVFLEWRRLSLSPCLVVSYSTASTREGHLFLIGWWWAHKAHCCPFILSPTPSSGSPSPNLLPLAVRLPASLFCIVRP